MWWKPTIHGALTSRSRMICCLQNFNDWPAGNKLRNKSVSTSEKSSLYIVYAAYQKFCLGSADAPRLSRGSHDIIFSFTSYNRDRHVNGASYAFVRIPSVAVPGKACLPRSVNLRCYCKCAKREWPRFAKRVSLSRLQNSLSGTVSGL
jgi:hypothetical protein